MEGGAEREQKIVARYQKLLLSEPRAGLILNRLIEITGTGPGLDGVIRDVEKVAAKRPDDAKPQILLGHLYARRGRAGDSLAAFEAGARLAPGSTDAEVGLGTALLEAGRQGEAQAAFERAVEGATSEARKRELYRRLVDLALAAGRDGQALGWFERLVDGSPRDPDLRVELAELLVRIGRLDDAVAQYEKALTLVGRDGKRRAELLRDIGGLRRQMHDPRGAIEAYRIALSLAARGSWMRRELYVRMIDAYRDVHQVGVLYEELRKEWARPTYADAMMLAGLAQELGRDAEATNWLRAALRKDKTALEPRTLLIARLDALARHDEVRELYDEVIDLQPERLSHRLDLAEWLFFSQRKPQAAMDVLADVEKRVAKDAEALVSVAETWGRFGLVDRAYALHERVAREHPHHVSNIEALGRLQARLGRMEEARATFEGLLDSELEPLRARLRVATQLASLGAWEEVIAHLEWCVQEAPELLDIRQQLAVAYESTRRWPDALREWERLFAEHGISHAGDRAVAIVGRTSNYGFLKKWVERHDDEPTVSSAFFVAKLRRALDPWDPRIAELLEEVVEQDPAALAVDERRVWVESARMHAEGHVRLGRVKVAAAIWARLGDAFGSERVPAYQRVAALALRLDATEGEQLIRLALDRAPNDPEVQMHGGYFFADRGQLDLAIRHLRRAVELGPTGFDVHFDLAHFLAQRGERDEARDVLLRVVERDWSGTRATAAALTALDLAESDPELRELERRFRQLRGSVNDEAFRTIMVAVYSELFVYSESAEGAFATLGEAAFPILLDALKSRQEDERYRALTLLALYPGSRVVQGARSVWGDPKAWSPEMAFAIGRAATSGAASLLVEAAQSGSTPLRVTALAALGLSADDSAADWLADFVVGDHPSAERRLAILALGRAGGRQAVDLLSAVAVGDADDDVRVAATWAMGATRSDAAVGPLARLLRDLDPEVAQVAAWSLANIRTAASARALFASWWSTNARVRARAHRGLLLRPDELVAWPERSEFVRPDRASDLADEVVAAALDAPAGPWVVTAVAAQRAAAVAVAREQLAAADTQSLVVGDLLAIAGEADAAGDHETIRAVVADLRTPLREIASTASGPPLLGAALLLPRAQQSDDIAIVLGAASRIEGAAKSRVIGELSRFGWKEARAPLLRAASSTDSNVRAAALRAIGRAKDAASENETTTLLTRLVGDSDVEVRLAAVEALSALGHEAATDALAKQFESSDIRTRAAIISTLRGFGTERARRELKKLELIPLMDPCKGDSSDLADLLSDDCTQFLGQP